MKKIAGGFMKWIVSYLAVFLVIMLMPVFLITKDVSAFDGIINYLFDNNS
ncbi:hypothetical protein DFR56_105128 [Pseudogracilibacillus auburnensis]|uniref:Uncharacterized protein n=2 Tax=Pseudogracilibacillus auburnensis TaxID=1494959 RepID=A0A2V3W139_9BACI|nr:hypothetical protein DFR56_105128 [Pseudogracilibacillus auburnensis]